MKLPRRCGLVNKKDKQSYCEALIKLQEDAMAIIQPVIDEINRLEKQNDDQRRIKPMPNREQKKK